MVTGPRFETPPTDGSTSTPPHDHHDSQSSANPFEPVFQKLGELFEYASEYLSIRQDKAKASLRQLLVKVVMGVFAAVMALTALLVAVVLLMVGLAGWIGTLLGDQNLGNILLGGGLCLLAAVGLQIALYQWGAWNRRKTIEKYERRHAKQRAAFSHDVAEQAARRRPSV